MGLRWWPFVVKLAVVALLSCPAETKRQKKRGEEERSCEAAPKKNASEGPTPFCCCKLQRVSEVLTLTADMAKEFGMDSIPFSEIRAAETPFASGCKKEEKSCQANNDKEGYYGFEMLNPEDTGVCRHLGSLVFNPDKQNSLEALKAEHEHEAHATATSPVSPDIDGLLKAVSRAPAIISSYSVEEGLGEENEKEVLGDINIFRRFVEYLGGASRDVLTQFAKKLRPYLARMVEIIKPLRAKFLEKVALMVPSGKIQAICAWQHAHPEYSLLPSTSCTGPRAGLIEVEELHNGELGIEAPNKELFEAIFLIIFIIINIVEVVLAAACGLSFVGVAALLPACQALLYVSPVWVGFWYGLIQGLGR